MRNTDPRVSKTQVAVVSASEGSLYLRNTYGLRLENRDCYSFMYCSGVARDGDSTTTGMYAAGSHKFRELDPETVAGKAVHEAVSQLHAAPVASGKYRVALDREAMGDLLATFCGMFSAENVQQQLSLLGGKEGTVIASPVVTLVDDPLLPGGLASCPFDA